MNDLLSSATDRGACDKTTYSKPELPSDRKESVDPPEVFARYLASEVQRWANVKQANIRAS